MPRTDEPGYRTLRLVADNKLAARAYVRISQDRTGDAAGVERQETEIRARAAELGLTIARVYADNDTSATSGARRPGFESLLAELAAVPRDERTVIAWAQDRLLRTARDLERVIDLEATVYFVVAGVVDLTTPTGRAIARMVTAWSTLEIEQKSERQRARNRQAAEQGRPYWTRRPFGWQTDGTLHPQEGPALRWAVDRVLADGDRVSIRQIARQFGDWGLTTYAGAPWNPTTLRKLLLSERLAGLRTYEGVQRQMPTVEPVCTEAEWRVVVAALESPARGAGNTSGRMPKTLLGGIAACGECGEPAYGARVSGDAYYRCSGCRRLYRKAEPVEAYVSAAVIARLELPDAAETLEPSAESGAEGAVNLAAQAAALTERRAVLARLFAQGVIDEAQLAEGSQELGAELERVEAALAAEVRGRVLLPVMGDRNAQEVWDELDLEGRRTVISTLLDRVVLNRGRRGGARFDPATVELVWAQG